VESNNVHPTTLDAEIAVELSWTIEMSKGAGSGPPARILALERINTESAATRLWSVRMPARGGSLKDKIQSPPYRRIAF
jgi:hypothetical protein